MKDIGGFKETYNSDRYPSIFTAIHDEAPENKSKILNYLKNGRVEAYAPGYFHDKVGSKDVIPAVCYTDGEYEWRSDTIYYYEHYNIDLPDDFIKHVLKKSK